MVDEPAVEETVEEPQSGKVTLQTSPHFEEYLTLMEGGWASISLERYAAYRYGEKLPASVFRQYKHRHQVQVVRSPLAALKTPETAELAQIDVMRVRAELVSLQLQRIVIDAKHEQEMQKLFNTTGREIDLLAKLLDQVKLDQRDYGILPEKTIAIVTPTDEDEEGPRKRATLGEVLGLSDPDEVLAAAEALGRVIQMRGVRSA